MAEQKKASEDAKDERVFSREQLIEDGPSALGVPGHTVAGALYGVKKDTLTLAEAENAVKKYLGR